MNAYDEYMRQVAQPMRDELTQAGFLELTTAEEVTDYMEESKGYTFVVINSVCGCAAGLARPAATESMKTEGKKPDAYVTVFAGQDKEATAKMRGYLDGFEPSSPSMALMKGNECLYFIPRERIEGSTIEDITSEIKKSFEDHIS